MGEVHCARQESEGRKGRERRQLRLHCTMAPSTPESGLTLKGSTVIVTEFFEYSINSILFQRGVYPTEDFKRVSKYGCTIMVSSNPKVRAYLDMVLKAMKKWLFTKAAQKLVLVIIGIDSGKTLERWVFNVHSDKADTTGISTKSDTAIKSEIGALIRQITSSVSFLPLLDELCKFDVLIYTDDDVAVPIECEESGPMKIAKPERVELRAIDTNIHRVG